MALTPIPGYKTFRGTDYGYYGGGGFTVPKKPAVPKTNYIAGYGPGQMGPPSAGYESYVGLTPGSFAPPSIADTGGSTGGDTTTDDGSAGFDPNGYLGELEADPMWQAAAAAYRARSDALRSALTGGIETLGIRSGYDLGSAMRGNPSLAAYAGDFTDADRLAAEQNPFSTRALNQQAFDTGQRALRYQLAGQGTLRGGGWGTGNTGLLNTQRLNDYNAMNQLLDQITGNVGTYLSGIDQATATRNAAQEAVASRLAQLYGATYGKTPATKKPPVTTTTTEDTVPTVSITGAPIPPEYDPTRLLRPGQIAWA
jgi:hypothetical protein